MPWLILAVLCVKNLMASLDIKMVAFFIRTANYWPAAGLIAIVALFMYAFLCPNFWIIFILFLLFLALLALCIF